MQNCTGSTLWDSTESSWTGHRTTTNGWRCATACGELRLTTEAPAHGFASNTRWRSYETAAKARQSPVTAGPTAIPLDHNDRERLPSGRNRRPAAHLPGRGKRSGTCPPTTGRCREPPGDARALLHRKARGVGGSASCRQDSGGTDRAVISSFLRTSHRLEFPHLPGAECFSALDLCRPVRHAGGFRSSSRPWWKAVARQ